MTDDRSGFVLLNDIDIHLENGAFGVPFGVPFEQGAGDAPEIGYRNIPMFGAVRRHLPGIPEISFGSLADLMDRAEPARLQDDDLELKQRPFHEASLV